MLESFYVKLALAYGGLRDRMSREEGQALVEYALIITLIAVAAIVALRATGTSITNIFNGISSDI
jgi:pilus assembly protein Flp/PilA